MLMLDLLNLSLCILANYLKNHFDHLEMSVLHRIKKSTQSFVLFLRVDLDVFALPRARFHFEITKILILQPLLLLQISRYLSPLAIIRLLHLVMLQYMLDQCLTVFKKEETQNLAS